MTKSASKVLVIGGAGYIGSVMVQALLEAKRLPVVFDSLVTGCREAVPSGVPFVKGDLRKAADVRSAFKRHEVGSVMHFAASSLVGESVEKPLKYYENNVGAMVNLLEAMLEAGVHRLVFSSTSAVFGEPKHLPIQEEDPKDPTNPYGRSKLMIEQMLRDVAHVSPLRYAALRYFNACGAHKKAGERHDPEAHLIPNALKAVTGEKKELNLFGDDYDTPDGTCVRDYVHVKDLAWAHLLALKSLEKGAASDVFNLGNGNGYSVKEIIQAVERVTGRRVPVRVKPRRPGDPARLIADASKAEKVLGWKAEHGLDEIVSSAWAWETKYRNRTSRGIRGSSSAGSGKKR